VSESVLGRGPPADLLRVVDLPGECSVAFAAGLLPAADPVFAFENWPHPLGVVPAHLALAAALYYQPMFARRPVPDRRVPAIVLDRNRLALLDPAAGRFNNRYVARLPPEAELWNRGIRRVLYLVPADAPPVELDDLVALFDDLRGAGIDVRLVSLRDFAPAAAPAPAPVTGPPTPEPDRADAGTHYWYGGSPLCHWWFWHVHPWYPLPFGASPVAPLQTPLGGSWTPARRPTMFDHLDPG